MCPSPTLKYVPEKVTQDAVDKILAGWPATPKGVARKMIQKYGLPSEVTPSRLVWHKNGPWKRTVLYRDEVLHNFPSKHVDVLEQVIDYRVAPEQLQDLAAYNGSVSVCRTKGEMSAMCSMEERNFLALNLAHDLVTGRSSVEEVRQSYVRVVKALLKGYKHPYTQQLLFQQVERDGTADPDVEIIKE